LRHVNKISENATEIEQVKIDIVATVEGHAVAQKAISKAVETNLQESLHSALKEIEKMIVDF